MANISQSSSLLAIARRPAMARQKKAGNLPQLPYLKLLSVVLDRPLDQVAKEAAARVPARLGKQ